MDGSTEIDIATATDRILVMDAGRQWMADGATEIRRRYTA